MGLYTRSFFVKKKGQMLKEKKSKGGFPSKFCYDSQTTGSVGPVSNKVTLDYLLISHAQFSQ